MESVNSEYGRICSKNIAWKYAQPRLDTAIIKHNEPEKALEIIAECCEAQIPKESLDSFRNKAEVNEERNELRRTPEAQFKKNAQRWDTRKSNKANKTEGYHPLQIKTED